MVTAGAVPLEVHLDDSHSSDQDGDALIYNSNLGDGTSGVGAKVSHTYTAEGSFVATLTVDEE